MVIYGGTIFVVEICLKKKICERRKELDDKKWIREVVKISSLLIKTTFMEILFYTGKF
jgi:hypothetical protein